MQETRQAALPGGLQPGPRSCHPDGPTRLHSSGGAATQATSRTVWQTATTHDYYSYLLQLSNLNTDFKAPQTALI